MNYRKIPKISPRAYINFFFQRPFSRGLFLEGLMHGGKFAFQNRLGWPYSWKEIYRFSVLPCIWGQFASTSPQGDLYLEGSFNGGFLRYEFGGLIFGGAYFRNFTVYFFCSAMLYCNICSRIFTDKKFAQTAHNNEICISFI